MTVTYRSDPSVVQRRGTLVLWSRNPASAVDEVEVKSEAIATPDASILAHLRYTVTGSPALFALRWGLEGSVDGENWFEIARLPDQSSTTAGEALCRIVAASGTSSAALISLGSASPSGAVVDGPCPGWLRIVTRIVTLTGGADPVVTIAGSIMGASRR